MQTARCTSVASRRPVKTVWRRAIASLPHCSKCRPRQQLGALSWLGKSSPGAKHSANHSRENPRRQAFTAQQSRPRDAPTPKKQLHGLLGALLQEPASLLLVLCALSRPAQAADSAYNAAQGSETLRNVVGVLYIVLLTFFAGRLFLRRAKRSKNQRVYGRKERSKALELLDKATERANPTSPLSALAGAAQAGALCFVLYLFTTRVDGAFETAQLPSNFTARNITLTVQTIVRAVSYLFTFIAGVNTVGLLGLTIQLIIYPEKAEDFDEDNY